MKILIKLIFIIFLSFYSFSGINYVTAATETTSGDLPVDLNLQDVGGWTAAWDKIAVGKSSVWWECSHIGIWINRNHCKIRILNVNLQNVCW